MVRRDFSSWACLVSWGAGPCGSVLVQARQPRARPLTQPNSFSSPPGHLTPCFQRQAKCSSCIQSQGLRKTRLQSLRPNSTSGAKTGFSDQAEHRAGRRKCVQGRAGGGTGDLWAGSKASSRLEVCGGNG